MALYYNGNLDEDLKRIENAPYRQELEEICANCGYGRAQQLLDRLDEVDGNLPAEPMAIVGSLESIRQAIGSHEAKLIIQILWAKYLHDLGYPTHGALGPR